MLTLQMAAGNDNTAVWCIRMKSEGTTIVSNGTFTVDTGWTVDSGDWSFADGVAKYIYVDDSQGDIDHTVPAVSAIPYVLEYEITSRVQDSGTSKLELGGPAIIGATTTIPSTLGQHRFVFQGNAAGTLLRFHAATFDTNDILHLDNVKLRPLEETTYLATETLSLDNTYDGQVLEFNDRISDIDSFVDTQSSGTIGGVASYQFTIARYNDNTKFDGYHEEFAPCFNGGNLTSMDCEIGLVWNTASTDTEITWLMRGRIVDYRFTPRKMYLTILQSTEIDSRPLPYYKVQKDFDNEVSYFPQSPTENFGKTIPIVYGTLHQTIGLAYVESFVPTVRVDKNKYLFASHNMYNSYDLGGGETDDRLFEYIAEYDTMLGLTEYDYVHNPYNTYAENTSSPIRIDGDLSLYPHTIEKTDATITGELTDITTPQGIAVQTDYIEIPNTKVLTLGFKNAENIIGQIGAFSAAAPATSGQVSVICAGETAGSDFELKMVHPDATIYITAATRTPGTAKAGENFTLIIGAGFSFERFMESFIIITNNTGAAEYIRIYDVIFSINGTVKTGIQTKQLYARNPSRIYAQPGGYLRRYTRYRYPNGDIPVAISPKIENDITWDGDNVLATGLGRPFGRWIDYSGTTGGGTRNENNGAANDPGFTAETSIIDTPAYIIESLFRDEIFVERDLQITATSAVNIIQCDGLRSSEASYYNNAEVINVTTGAKSYITGYVGTTKTLTIQDNDGAMAVGDNFFLTNIQGDNRIDIESFDTVGNETDGTREAGDGWEFARSVDAETSLEVLISDICFESHSQIFEAADEDAGYSKIKIVALDAASSGDTWAKPAFRKGIESVVTSLTPLSNIYTSFRLFYKFDYEKQDYGKEIFVDKNSLGGTGTLVDADQLLCKKAEETYRITNPFSYQANWIYDDTAAELMLQKKIEWFTKQRLIVDWTTGLSDGVIDYVEYELGDQVKLNYSQAIPTGLNNSSYFMITNKRIITVQGAPLIQWKLIEMG